jgi:hypothetical protein
MGEVFSRLPLSLNYSLKANLLGKNFQAKLCRNSKKKWHFWTKFQSLPSVPSWLSKIREVFFQNFTTPPPLPHQYFPETLTPYLPSFWPWSSTVWECFFWLYCCKKYCMFCIPIFVHWYPILLGFPCTCKKILDFLYSLWAIESESRLFYSMCSEYFYQFSFLDLGLDWVNYLLVKLSAGLPNWWNYFMKICIWNICQCYKHLIFHCRAKLWI